MEVPEEPGDGVICHVLTLQSCCENFIQIQHQEPYQDSFTCPFLESWGTEMMLGQQEHPSDLSSRVPSRSNINKTSG